MEDHSQQEDLNDILLKLGHYIGSQDFATGKAYLETQGITLRLLENKLEEKKGSGIECENIIQLVDRMLEIEDYVQELERTRSLLITLCEHPLEIGKRVGYQTIQKNKEMWYKCLREEHSIWLFELAMKGIFDASIEISQLSANIILDLIKLDGKYDFPLISKDGEALKEFMEKAIGVKDKVLYIRVLELLINLVNHSQFMSNYFTDLLTLCLNNFFKEDVLVQLNIMDIVTNLGQWAWSAQVLIDSKFIQRVILQSEENEGLFDLIGHSFVIMMSRVYSFNPETLDIFNTPKFMQNLFMYLLSNKEEDIACAASVLYFVFKHKKSVENLIKYPKIVHRWLSISQKHSTEDTKLSFLTSITSLLSQEDLMEDIKQSENICLIFSHIGTAELFPNSGNIEKSINYITRLLLTPFEAMELQCLQLLLNLINWEWGIKHAFKNIELIQYLISRKTKSKSVCERKYDVVRKAASLGKGILEEGILKELHSYVLQGVFGENAPHKGFDPQQLCSTKLGAHDMLAKRQK